MKISYLRIRNFKSIRDLEINELENALILVGKNNLQNDALTLQIADKHDIWFHIKNYAQVQWTN